MSSDAIIQPGSSGSPILNSKHEAIGVIYAGNKPSGESTRGFAVYSLLKLRNSLQII